MKWIQISLCVCERDMEYLYVRANGIHGQLQYSKQLSTLLWAITVPLGYALYESFQLYLPLEIEKPTHPAFVR